jgi:uroporphyrin-III C-methyltransferase
MPRGDHRNGDLPGSRKRGLVPLDGGPVSAARAGVVHLVGAGPGDPDLLTVKALRLLQSADVVVHDRLTPEAILILARPDARMIDVGKRKSRHTLPQDDINQLLVALAREGLNVVRLKGGDPFVFGRGGEELDSLRMAGIPVEVVPGVTAACAAAASLQIPLTHRDLSRSLHFVTGHGSDGTVPGHDWTALARSGGTIAAYMAGRTLSVVAERLMAAGMAGSVPAVAVENASRAGERRLFGTLAELPRLLAQAGSTGPTLVLIGAVVGLAEAAAAFERLAA